MDATPIMAQATLPQIAAETHPAVWAVIALAVGLFGKQQLRRLICLVLERFVNRHRYEAETLEMVTDAELKLVRQQAMHINRLEREIRETKQEAKAQLNELRKENNRLKQLVAKSQPCAPKLHN